MTFQDHYNMGDDHSLPLFYQNFLSPVSEAMLDGAMVHTIYTANHF